MREQLRGLYIIIDPAVARGRDEVEIAREALAVSAAVLIPAKLFQEYVLHYGRWLDSFTAVEAVEAIWEWLTGPIR